ncbi:MAG: hypothetical protein U0936_19965 [Planctomycetaceae bacterium]
MLHVYGDADEVVPWDENTKVIADRYKELGGEMVLIERPESATSMALMTAHPSSTLLRSTQNDR